MNNPPSYKTRLQQLHQQLRQQLEEDYSGSQLVQTMTAGVDALVIDAWQQLAPTAAQRADLVAVGGYGRGDLAPRSDWDMCILLPAGKQDALEEEIATFLRALWDCGAKVGAATRTLKQSLEEIADDTNTATAALESRLLAGEGREFARYERKIRRYFRRHRKAFVESKLEEMQYRHQRQGNTVCLMEPDIKENCGGLRDVHSVFWMARAWYGLQSIAELQQHGAISEGECQHLLSARDFLWRCRCRMHLQGRRANDKLNFECQAALAEDFGYRHQGVRPAVEVFMKDFFRHSGRIARVSGLLTMHFQEQLQPRVFAVTWPLEEGFSERAQRVDIQQQNVFREEPLRLLKVFQLAQQGRRQLSSNALRQVRADVLLIDDAFRNDAEANAMFMAILRHPRNVATTLRAMNDTGVLGRFIPAFRDVVGLGQFNRYHAYTVDEHTLRAIGEARNFVHQEHEWPLPLVGEVISQVRRPALLYLALLFHDIGKGKAGDHSLLGRDIARQYGQRLGLHAEHVELVSWLVEKHLHMAMTSQRCDLSDPEVIARFARDMGDQERLDYLFLLTVADIVAVGPAVWNSWKGELLSTLYREASRWLLTGELPREHIRQRTEARIQRAVEGCEDADRQALQQALACLPARALMHFSARDLLMIGRCVQHACASDEAHVHGSIDGELASFAIVAVERHGLFAELAETLSSGRLSVLRAQAFPLPDGKLLDVFTIRADEGTVLTEEDIQRLRQRLLNILAQPYYSGSLRRRRFKPHVLMHQVSPGVRLLPGASSRYTALEVTAADRPGLLAQLAGCISKADLHIEGASVSTFGEKAVDVFFITDGGQQLDEETVQQLKQALLDVASITGD